MPGDAWQPDLDGDGRILLRHQPREASEWTYAQTGWVLRVELELPSGEHTSQMAYLRHPIEAETPGALNWNRSETNARLEPAPNLRATATHDTVTVSFDDQLGFWDATVALGMSTPAGGLQGRVQKSFHSYEARSADGGRHQVVFNHVPPNSAFTVQVWLGTADLGSTYTTTTVRTAVAPSDWTAPAQGPQNLRATGTHESITVRWDAPYEDPDIYYSLTVNEVDTGKRFRSFFLAPEQREWTIRGGHFELLRPNTEYRVVVEHKGIPFTSAEIIVSTLPTPSPQGVAGRWDAGRSLLYPFLPAWLVDSWWRAALITTDPTTWPHWVSALLSLQTRARGNH